LARWPLVENQYVVQKCRERIDEMRAIEGLTKKKHQEWKPKHQWTNGADKLFYDNHLGDVGYA
jgi:hypothetical protein